MLKLWLITMAITATIGSIVFMLFLKLNLSLFDTGYFDKEVRISSSAGEFDTRGLRFQQRHEINEKSISISETKHKIRKQSHEKFSIFESIKPTKSFPEKEMLLHSNEIICPNGLLVNVEVLTDSFPASLFHGWDIFRLSTKEISWSSSNFYTTPHMLFNESKCLDHGPYKFNFHNTNGNGISEAAYFIFRVNNEVKLEVHGKKKFFYQEATFGGCRSNDECNDGDFCTFDTCNMATGQCLYDFVKNPNPLCRAFGSQQILVARVVAMDSAPSMSKEEISNQVFGTDGRNFSMRSQFLDCSNQKFNSLPWESSNVYGQPTIGGVVDISIPINATNVPAATVATYAVIKTNVTMPNLAARGNFLITCLPPGTKIGTTSTWKAFAFVNDRRSFYNDKACISPSVLMHELGHNLGFSHSNDEQNYGDESGMMGLSYTDQFQGPRKCYNGQKSWQLGWFSDSHAVFDMRYLHKTTVLQLVGITDYERRGERSTIIKLINGNDDNDYYIWFNRKDGANSETSEGADKVLVAKRPTGYLYGDSTLIAKLGKDPFTISEVDGSDNVMIAPVINLEASPPFAVVSILKFTSFCSEDSSCNDNNSCTVDKCENYYNFIKICTYTPIHDCGECGRRFSIVVHTNNSPQKIAWRLKDDNTDKIIRSSGYYSNPYTLYNNSECVQYGKYKFSVQYSDNFTYWDSFNISIYVDDLRLDHAQVFGLDSIEGNFLICSSDQECFDYDGCSTNFCNHETGLCSNIVYEDETNCRNCSWFSLNITSDNYPEETTWGLSNYDTNEFILTGNPYALYALRSGRRKGPTKASRKKASGRSSNLGALNILGEEIFERVCLFHGTKYNFKISDSFGDGICCSEGIGKYSLEINDILVKAGGRFSFSQELTFKAAQCQNDLECDDGNPCSVDICLASQGLCVYTAKPCEECGMMISINVFTDWFPNQITWRINGSGNTEIGGPYSKSRHQYSEDRCIAYGSHLFSIFDTGGTGMTWCCQFQTITPENVVSCLATQNCGYNITTSNETLLVGNADFGSQQDSYIGICTDDNHCDDGDKCTFDTCDLEKKICIFEPLPCVECADDPCDIASTCLDPLPCSACGKTLTTFEMNTDFYPPFTRWEIKDTKSNETVLDGGPYGEVLSRFIHNVCLPDGDYELIVSDLGLGVGSGIFYCNFEGAYCGNYALKLNEIILFVGNRNFFGQNKTSFEIREETIPPTTNPTSIPSESLPLNTMKPTSANEFVKKSKSPVNKAVGKNKKNKKRNHTKTASPTVKKKKEKKKKSTKRKKKKNLTKEKKNSKSKQRGKVPIQH